MTFSSISKRRVRIRLNKLPFVRGAGSGPRRAEAALTVSSLTDCYSLTFPRRPSALEAAAGSQRTQAGVNHARHLGEKTTACLGERSSTAAGGC